jgi:hypothetical protein
MFVLFMALSASVATNAFFSVQSNGQNHFNWLSLPPSTSLHFLSVQPVHQFISSYLVFEWPPCSSILRPHQSRRAMYDKYLPASYEASGDIAETSPVRAIVLGFHRGSFSSCYVMVASLCLVPPTVVSLGFPPEAAHENAQRHRQLSCHGDVSG